MAGPAPSRRRDAGDAPRGAAPRFAVVAARFNERITERLVDGARHAFADAKVAPEDVDLYWVPGSFELPQAASHLAATRR